MSLYVTVIAEWAFRRYTCSMPHAKEIRRVKGDDGSIPNQTFLIGGGGG